MNIQDREKRGAEKKKIFLLLLGTIHLLKLPCQDNTELNISLSMLNTFMIQTEKQRWKPIALSPAPWLILDSQIKVASYISGLWISAQHRCVWVSST